MKPLLQMQKLRKIGIFLTVLLIAVFVISIAYLVRIIFDYKISEALIAAIIAGMSLLYEINKSKKLNEAEFLVHLNSLFITNDDYKKVYNLLSQYDFEHEPDLEDEITNCDISNYLTLFETLYILLKRKVIDIKTLDDLFAYRFFLAVHNPYIQRKKLCASPKNFKNIFRLERMWLNYRKKIESKDNYFGPSYHLIHRTSFDLYLKVFDDKEQKKIKKEISLPSLDNAYTVKKITVEDFDIVYQMQLDAVVDMEEIHPNTLRANSKDMIKKCLEDPHQAIAVVKEEKIIGFGMLFDPSQEDNESLLKDIDVIRDPRFKLVQASDVMHIKLVVVDKAYRGQHLQFHMNQYLESLARSAHKKVLLTTVSPFNHASVINTSKSGFNYVKSIHKYGGALRLIYAKFL